MALKKYQVYCEPELWNLLRKRSIIDGCKSHPSAGSASEAARIYIKRGLLGKTPTLKNVNGVNWAEADN